MAVSGAPHLGRRSRHDTNDKHQKEKVIFQSNGDGIKNVISVFLNDDNFTQRSPLYEALPYDFNLLRLGPGHSTPVTVPLRAAVVDIIAAHFVRA